MNGWVKYFAYGQTEYGQDKDVAKKKASWSKGRLDGMIGAEIYHNDLRVIKIFGPGLYHQSDDYDVVIYQSKPTLRIRRLQKQIQKEDAFVVGHHYDNKTVSLHTTNEEVILSNNNYSIFCGLPPNVVKEWLTVEYDVEFNEIAMYISKDII